MPFQLSITEKPGYLHFVVTGPNTMEVVTAYLQQVMEECMARRCRRVLVEERLSGPRLDTMTVFQIASKGSGQALGRFEAIAYVDVNADGNLMQFAENVAVNRALPMRLFSTVHDAEKWLQESHSAPGRV